MYMDRPYITLTDILNALLTSQYIKIINEYTDSIIIEGYFGELEDDRGNSLSYLYSHNVYKMKSYDNMLLIYIEP